MENSNKDLDEKKAEIASQAYEAFNRGDIQKPTNSFRQDASLNNSGTSPDSGNSKGLNNVFAQSPFEKHKEDTSDIFKTELKNLFDDDKKA